MISLVNHLIHQGLMDDACAQNALREAKLQNISLVRYLIKNKLFTGDIITECCEKVFALPFFNLDSYHDDWLAQSLLNLNFIKQYRVVPLHKSNHILHLGITDPSDQHAMDAVAFHTGLRVVPMLICDEQLSQFIENRCGKNEEQQNLQGNLIKQISLESNTQAVQDNIIQYDEPLVKFVDNMIIHAFQQSASDVHIEPYESVCRVRYRQHGVLYETNEIPNSLAVRLAARLKVMAKLDIAERRLPQDGRFQLNHMDVRINTCPTLWGEKIVLRLLNTGNISLEIDRLGLSLPHKKIFLKSISQPQGLILVTGPTGSGKTVTLYSALNYLNTAEKNISTVEDPIEIRLSGINQVNVHPKIGLSFSSILRTLLRQDPDIMMVGEIRDAETASIALQAAQTGHLVLSTLHTNSAIETISRLQAMGIPSYNIIGSVSLIMAQRLVRKLCSHCKQPEIELNHFYRAVGCAKCKSGYNGRFAIYEFLPISDEIAKLILANANRHEIISYAKQYGFKSLKETGLEKVAQGETSLAEINRVLAI